MLVLALHVGCYPPSSQGTSTGPLASGTTLGTGDRVLGARHARARSRRAASGSACGTLPVAGTAACALPREAIHPSRSSAAMSHTLGSPIVRPPGSVPRRMASQIALRSQHDNRAAAPTVYIGTVFMLPCYTRQPRVSTYARDPRSSGDQRRARQATCQPTRIRAASYQ